MQENLMKVGQLKKPYGIKGWLWVFSDTDNREDLFAIKPLFIKTAKGMQPLTLQQWRKQGSGLVAQFKEVPDRNIAETMNGVSIWAEKQGLPELEEDEYYWSELEGYTVYNEADVCFGEIHELFATGANDVMVVKPTSESLDNEERLIPWHKTVVLSVTRETKTMVVDWQPDY